MKCNLVIMVRGDRDIIYACLRYHAKLGFDRIVMISHVEHNYCRAIAGLLRENCGAEIVFIEIDDPEKFSERKARYVNEAIALITSPSEENLIYCCDADEFLYIGRFRSVKDLAEHLVLDGSTERPIYLSLPWIDMLLAPSSRNPEVSMYFDDFLFADYLVLDDGGWNGTKTIFEADHARSVNMGFHWLHSNGNGERIFTGAEADAFVTTEQLCVYHLPMRSRAQFKQRMKNYKQSADPTSKYNILSSLIEADNGVITEDVLFDWCVAAEPRFINLDEVSRFFEKISGPSFSPNSLETIAKYLTSKRSYVGDVLNHRRSY